MAPHVLYPGGAAWPASRPSSFRRTLAFSGFLLLLLVVLGTLKLVSVETMKLEKRHLASRQFQLGGILGGGAFREVLEASTSSTDWEFRDDSPDKVASRPTQNVIIQSTAVPSRTLATQASGKGGPSPTDASPEPSRSQSQSQNSLLEALTDAVKAIMKQSSSSPSSESSNELGSFVSDLVANGRMRPRPDAAAPSGPALTSHGVALSNSPHSRVTKSEALTRNSLTMLTRVPEQSLAPSIGILGGLIGASLRSGALHGRATPQPPSEVPPANESSLLTCLAKIVNEVCGIDPAAAARLIDAVLQALHVNSSAVASVVPEVAQQASVNPADMLPLIIPAVSSAMGEKIHANALVGPPGKVNVLNDVLEQGTTIINELSRATGGLVDPALQSVLNQVASIISAAANILNVPLCAITRVWNDTSYEVVMPCNGTDAAPAATSQPSPQSGLSTLAIEPSSETIVTLVLPSPYLQTAEQTPAAALTSAIASNQYQDTVSASASGIGGGSGSGTPTSTSASVVHPCFTCLSCEQCPPSKCSISGPNEQGGQQSPDTAVGPCPGRGFKCADCPDGWFCPPQETPALPAPCGVGWPCYHCSSGWFCDSQASASRTGSVPATKVPSSLVPAATPAATPAPQASAGLPQNWKYLGCFQDAISRTLMGGKPVDYLQGDMSGEVCVSHCGQKGYRFAGTENGKECWCGDSIRDDAVRLPVAQCATPCQGKEGLCGGAWAVSVYVCLPDDDAGPSKGGQSGARSRLLAAFKAGPGLHRGWT